MRRVGPPWPNQRWSPYHGTIMELGCGQVPFSFHVDDRRGLFHIQAIGEVNGAELMELSDRLRHEAAFVAEYPILCDCSNLTAVSISSSLINRWRALQGRVSTRWQ